MGSSFDPRPAASLLADSWRTGNQLLELPIEVRPRTLAEGYDVQDCLIEELDDEVVGWKLGVGSPKAKRQAGLARAIAGRVLRSSCYRHGDTVRLANARPATVEFEVAFVLARFVDRRAVGWPSFAADNAGFAALIVGDSIDLDRVPDIAPTLSVKVNGKEMAQSVANEDVIDPLTALGEMLDHARERRLTLLRGSIISTGTLSQPFEISGRSNQITACYLGSTLEFVTAVG